jgi:hypothetical protein
MGVKSGKPFAGVVGKTAVGTGVDVVTGRKVVIIRIGEDDDESTKAAFEPDVALEFGRSVVRWAEKCKRDNAKE